MNKISHKEDFRQQYNIKQRAFVIGNGMMI